MPQATKEYCTYGISKTRELFWSSVDYWFKRQKFLRRLVSSFEEGFYSLEDDEKISILRWFVYLLNFSSLGFLELIDFFYYLKLLDFIKISVYILLETLKTSFNRSLSLPLFYFSSFLYFYILFIFDDKQWVRKKISTKWRNNSIVS